MADELLLIGGPNVRGQQSYARNPLFYQDNNDVLRPVQSSGFGEFPDRGGDTLARPNADASPTSYGRRPEDAFAPFLESLRMAQSDPMYRAFAVQMDNLYQVFRELHEQDQGEIRKLLATLESQKQQLQQLVTGYDSVRQQLASRERELATAAVVAAAAGQLTREQQFSAPPPAGAAASSSSSLLRSERHPQLPLRPRLGLHQPEEPLRDSYESLEGGKDGDLVGSESISQVHGVAQRGVGPVTAAAAAGGGGSRPTVTAAAVRGERRPSGVGGGGNECGGGVYGLRVGRERSVVSRHGRRQYYILFLPYMLHPAHHCWSFYAAWQYSWTARRTLWLAMVWLLLFLTAVGLLVGFLVPWKRLTRTAFELGPQTAAVGPDRVSLVMRLDRRAAVYYAVVPEGLTAGEVARRRHLAGDTQSPAPATGRNQDAADGSARRGAPAAEAGGGGRGGGLSLRPMSRLCVPMSQCATPWRRLQPCGRRGLGAVDSYLQLGDVESDDVQRITGGPWDPDAALFPFTVACGRVDVTQPHTNYTLTVRNGVPPTLMDANAGGGGGNATAAAADECSASFGMAAVNSSLQVGAAAGPFFARRCERCPVLQPGTSYLVLLVGDGGRSTGVVQVRFTTANATASAASPPPLAVAPAA